MEKSWIPKISLSTKTNSLNYSNFIKLSIFNFTSSYYNCFNLIVLIIYLENNKNEHVKKKKKAFRFKKYIYQFKFIMNI